MKTRVSLWGIVCTVIMFLAMAITPANAFRNGGEFYGDTTNNVLRFSPNFAPNQGKVVSLGTKGVTTIALDTVAAIKFWFTKVSDGTAEICKVWFGTAANHSTAGGIPTSGDGPWHPGQDQSKLTFGCPSSATTHYLNYYVQKKP